MKRLGHGQSTLVGVFDVKLNLRFDMKCFACCCTISESGLEWKGM